MQDHELWIIYATGDLKAAKILLSNAEEVIVNAVLFHSQQCAEKALKAYLACNAIPFKKTHDLIYLVKCCATFDLSFNTMLDNAADLTPHATETRYPDSQFLLIDTVTAKIIMEQAEEVLEFVKMKLEE